MKDKVQKIREEVARIQLYTQSEVLKQVLDYIDEVEKEPVSSIWHGAGEPPIIDKTFLLIAPNGNSSLCLWGGKELHSVTIGGGHSVLCRGDIYSYIDDLLNLDNSCNFGKNLQEEPVSEDLEKAEKEWLTPQLDKSYADYGETKMMELTCFDGYAMLDAIEFGAKWQKEQFEKYRLAHCDALTEEQAQIESDFVIQHLKKNSRTPTFVDAIEYGMRLHKEQMMAKAIDGGCFSYKNGFVHISCDVDENHTDIKMGDKVKVIVIKED